MAEPHDSTSHEPWQTVRRRAGCLAGCLSEPFTIVFLVLGGLLGGFLWGRKTATRVEPEPPPPAEGEE
jgi:hypothetical protein